MLKFKNLKTTKFWAYVLIGIFFLYLNATEISYSQPLSPEKSVQEAKTLHKEGNYELSIEKLKQAEHYLKTIDIKAKSGKLAEIYFYQGLNFAKQGNMKAARILFKKAVQKCPDRKYDFSIQNDTIKELFLEAGMEVEKEFSPQAMGMVGNPEKKGSVVWVILAVSSVAAIGVIAYLLSRRNKEETSATGSLQVNSTPTGATIWLDDSNTGKTTNVLLTDLHIGSHVLKLTKKCYQYFETTIVVIKNQTTTVNAKLERAIPTLISPKEGEVLDNGRYDAKDYIEWDFDWSDVKGAAKYHLYVKHTGSRYPVIDKIIYNGSRHHHRKYGSYIIENNRFNWKWKVRAFVDGQWCHWSEVRRFDVEPPNTDPPL